MTEPQMWAAAWVTLAVGIVSLAAVIVVSSSLTDIRVAEMVKAGADPIAAKCAVLPSDTFSRSSNCQQKK